MNDDKKPGETGEPIELDVPQRSGEEKASLDNVVDPKQERRKKLTRRRWRLAGLIALGVAIALLGGVVMLYARAANTISGEATEAGTLPQEVKTQSIPEYTGKGIITGLICGVDYNNETADGYTTTDKIGNTDMILYLMYDTVNGKANVLQIPRDVYVGAELETGGTGKINGLYQASPDPDNRMAALANCVMDQLGLPVDFYIKLDVDALKALVDHRGTIEVYVPQDIVDKTTQAVLIEEGWRHFTGQEAEIFLRNRNYTDGDLTRLATQQSFYSALFREFKQLSPSDLVMWMRILMFYVDIGGIDLIQVGGLAQNALSLDGADLTFVRPPVIGTNYTAPNGISTDLVYFDAEGTAELLNEYFRPEGGEKSVEELDIHTLPDAKYGLSEATIRTMGDIQATEPEKPAE